MHHTTTTLHMMDLLDIEADRNAERLAAERRFDTGPDRCPYCNRRYDDQNGGWFGIYPPGDPEHDPLRPDHLEDGDIFVEEWQGWHRACGYCNEDGERWPASLTVRSFGGGDVQV